MLSRVLAEGYLHTPFHTLCFNNHYDENDLYAGQHLPINVALQWGTYIFLMQPDCNSCLYSSDYNPGNVAWCTQTNGNGDYCSVFMQRDGNLVVYNDRLVSLWKTSNTARPRGDYVLLREDGILAVYNDVLWTTQKQGPPIALRMMPSPSPHNLCATDVDAPPSNARYDQNVLYETERLTVNQELRARSFRFIMQADCNLVLYDAFTSIWVSGTDVKGTGCYLQLHKDDNLVIYNQGDAALWQSGTAKGVGDYVLILQNNGNVALYSKSLWSHKPIPDLTGASSSSTQQQLIVNTTTPRSSSVLLIPGQQAIA